MSAAPTLSCCVLTQNNARTIGHCLESVSMVASEIVVVDAGSSDGTVDIVRRFAGARVIESNFLDISSQRNVYLGAAKGDWILVLDADEVLGASLPRELPRLLASDHHSHYWLPRYWVASRRPLLYVENDVTYPDHQLRLFQRSSQLSYRGAVHQQIAISGPCAFLVRPHIFHLHYLLHDRQGREERLALYERLEPGSGSGLYRKYYVFEELPYRLRRCREGVAVDLSSLPELGVPPGELKREETDQGVEEHSDLP